MKFHQLKTVMYLPREHNMVRWFIKRIAVNEDTGQQANVFTGTSDFDDELYPTMFWEYFTNIPNFNTFTLVFTNKLVVGDDEFTKLLKGQDTEGA